MNTEIYPNWELPPLGRKPEQVEAEAEEFSPGSFDGEIEFMILAIQRRFKVRKVAELAKVLAALARVRGESDLP